MWAMNSLPPSSIAWSFLYCRLRIMWTINDSTCVRVSVCVYFPTPGTQNHSVVESCLFTFFPLSVCFCFRLYFYTSLSICPSSRATLSLSLSLSLTCLSLLLPVFLCDFVVSLTLFALFLSLLLCSSLSLSLSPLPHLPLSLSPSLKSVTYLQHSCLMNNGGETVTISVSISRIRLWSLLLSPAFSSQLSSQVFSSPPPFSFQLIALCFSSSWQLLQIVGLSSPIKPPTKLAILA